MGNNCLEGENCIEIKSRRSTQPTLSSRDLVQVKTIKINNQYQILKPSIGAGSYGQVYKVLHKSSGMIRAAKRINSRICGKQRLQEHISLMNLDHPNIVRVYDIYLNEPFIFIVTQYCSGPQLFTKIVDEKFLSQKEAKNYMLQILSAVSYCHANRITHRDIKPDNIMFGDPKSQQLRLIDFGASALISHKSLLSTKVGTAFYIAPQVIKKSYNEKCDIWSVGVILYIMLCGAPPFTGKTHQEVFKKIVQGKYNLPQKSWSKISDDAKDLISKLLEYNPQKRISARQALNHQWFFSNQKTYNIYLETELQSMTQFSKASKFQELVMAYIGHNLLTTQWINRLSEKFKKIDINLDGKISWNQFQQCYYSSMPQIDQEQLFQMFNKLDFNQSGYIDYSEFLSSIIMKEQISSQLTKAFKLIDKDNDGKLDKNQIVNAFGGLDEQMLSIIMEQCDLNKDGVISLQQFVHSMKNTGKSLIKIKQSQITSFTN